jgi:hypothetical protein
LGIQSRPEFTDKVSGVGVLEIAPQNRNIRAEHLRPADDRIDSLEQQVAQLRFNEREIGGQQAPMLQLFKAWPFAKMYAAARMLSLAG